MRYSKIMVAMLACSMMIGGMQMPNTVNAAKKIVLSKNKITLKVGAKKKLSLKNAKKGVIWKIVSGKGKISIKKKNKNTITIKGKKAGRAKVQALLNGKKYI